VLERKGPLPSTLLPGILNGDEGSISFARSSVPNQELTQIVFFGDQFFLTLFPYGSSLGGRCPSSLLKRKHSKASETNVEYGCQVYTLDRLASLTKTEMKLNLLAGALCVSLIDDPGQHRHQ
jgi:hypothetical protein